MYLNLGLLNLHLLLPLPSPILFSLQQPRHTLLNLNFLFLYIVDFKLQTCEIYRVSIFWKSTSFL